MKYFAGWSKRKKLKAVFFVALSLPLIYLLVIFLIINPIKIVQEKRTLSSYKSQLAQAKDELVKVAGTPDTINYDESCSYTSAKYEKGNLSCSMSYYINYDLGTAENANQSVKQISEKVGLTPLLNVVDNGDPALFKDGRRVELRNNIKYIDPRECGISYEYGNQLPIYDGFSFDPIYSSTLQIQLVCSMDSISEHYKVK